MPKMAKKQLYSQFYFLFQKGIRGFWKGVTASYWGISETVIHFVIYEYLKKQLAIAQNKRKTDEKTILDFVGFMACGACSKTCATIVAYPHGKLFFTHFLYFFLKKGEYYFYVSNLKSAHLGNSRI